MLLRLTYTLRGGDELYDIGLLHEIVKLDMYLPEEWALSKVSASDYKEVVSADEEFEDEQAPQENLSSKERKDKRDESLKRLFGKAKGRIEKRLALLNTNEGGQKHEVTHKKIMTLLGQPSTLPPDPVLNTKPAAKEEDTRRETARGGKLQPLKPQSTMTSMFSPRVKPKYLEPQKKGAFDLYFETLNVEIEENKALVRMMYMLMGGLIDESEVNPNKKKSMLANEDEAKTNTEMEFEEETTRTLRGFE